MSVSPRPSLDVRAHQQLVLLVCVLVGFGTVMVYSASAGMAQLRFENGHLFLQRWVIRALIALLAMAVVMHIDYRHYVRIARPLLLLAFLGLLAVLALKLLGVGKVRGANRWIPLPGGAFQPSDLMRLALVVFLADSLNRNRGVLPDFARGYAPHAGVVGAAMFLIVLQPDLGASLALGATCALLLFVAGVRVWHLLASGVALLPVVAFIVFVIGYRRERVMTFLYPDADVQKTGYQVQQSLVALGTGGLTGKGLGQSVQKFFFLPEPHTDFVFSIVGEELGLLATLGVLGLFVLFGVLGLRIARQARDYHGYLLASGVTYMVLVYAFINLGVATAVLPTTGLPLPFISYGGTSLLLTLCATGVLINVGRQGSLPQMLRPAWGAGTGAPGFPGGRRRPLIRGT